MKRKPKQCVSLVVVVGYLDNRFKTPIAFLSTVMHQQIQQRIGAGDIAAGNTAPVRSTSWLSNIRQPKMSLYKQPDQSSEQELGQAARKHYTQCAISSLFASESRASEK